MFVTTSLIVSPVGNFSPTLAIKEVGSASLANFLSKRPKPTASFIRLPSVRSSIDTPFILEPCDAALRIRAELFIFLAKVLANSSLLVLLFLLVDYQ